MANYIGVKQSLEYVPGMSIHWAGGRTSPPPDTPACGFDNSRCKSNDFHLFFFHLGFDRIAYIGMIECVFIFKKINFVNVVFKVSTLLIWKVATIYFTYAVYILLFRFFSLQNILHSNSQKYSFYLFFYVFYIYYISGFTFLSLPMASSYWYFSPVLLSFYSFSYKLSFLHSKFTNVLFYPNDSLRKNCIIVK